MNTKSRRHFVQNMGGMMGAIGITPFFSSDWFNSLNAALAPFDALTPEEAAKRRLLVLYSKSL